MYLMYAEESKKTSIENMSIENIKFITYVCKVGMPDMTEVAVI